MDELIVDVLDEDPEDVTSPTPPPEPAYRVIKRSQFTPLEAQLFRALYGQLSEFDVHKKTSPGIVNDIVDAKLTAMELVFKEKFKIQSVAQARRQNLKLNVKDDNTVELLKGRDD